MNPRRNPAIKTTLLPDGHVVLVSEATDWAHTLNPLGAMVWEFCDGSNSADDIARKLERLGAAPGSADLKDEVRSLIEELEAAGLLLTEPAG